MATRPSPGHCSLNPRPPLFGPASTTRCCRPSTSRPTRTVDRVVVPYLRLARRRVRMRTAHGGQRHGVLAVRRWVPGRTWRAIHALDRIPNRQVSGFESLAARSMRDGDRRARGAVHRCLHDDAPATAGASSRPARSVRNRPVPCAQRLAGTAQDQPKVGSGRRLAATRLAAAACVGVNCGASTSVWVAEAVTAPGASLRTSMPRTESPA
jgi:hypothetical protein